MSSFVDEAIECWAADALRRVGLRDVDSRWVAKSLIFADRSGVGTHGLMRLPVYLDRIGAGGINRRADCRVTHDLGALVILDADNAPGAASGVIAANLAVERGRQYGISCVMAHSANHFGASAFYTNRIADNDLLGLAICNTESVMCAPFGGRAVLGTNPLAVAVPLPADTRPQLDMATTTTSQGRLIVARQADQEIPTGWAVDATGRPTNSAAAGLAGALLPSGGPKGFGLAFAIDSILAAAGANTSQDVGALQGDDSRPQRLGQAFIALRVDVARPLAAYRKKINSLVEAIHQSGLPGSDGPPLAPGEPEQLRRRESQGRIRLSAAVTRELKRVGDAIGLPLPEHVGE
jgi:LDH2 family malate/lactate/ureidoglycolate dehydrogenase